MAYAIAGRVDIDLINEPVSYDPNQQPVFLKDIWPTDDEIYTVMNEVLSPEYFDKNYGEIFEGNEIWKKLNVPDDRLYVWDKTSNYIKEAPFFYNISEEAPPLNDLHNARALLVLGDSITTDHISPAGQFNEFSSADCEEDLSDRGQSAMEQGMLPGYLCAIKLKFQVKQKRNKNYNGNETTLKCK